MEPEEDKKLIGTDLYDRTMGFIGNTVSNYWQEARTIDNKYNPFEYIEAGLARTVEGVGHVAGAPGISHALRVIDSPFWVARQSVGGVLEHGLGIDPRYGHTAVGIAELIKGPAIATKATKLLKGRLISQVSANPYSRLHPISQRLGMTKPGTVGAMKYGDLGDDIPLSQRMANADLSQVPQSAKDISRARDRFAAITKGRIKQFVEEFGGTAEDVDRIYKTELIRHSNQKKSVAWLNKYFEELITEVDDTGKLKQFNIAEVNGKPTLVDRSGKVQSSYKWAFEKDHSKAKTLFESLGIPGADFSDNLDIVLTVFNRAKNNLGNPSIPDDILRATGQSTSLRELVQRSIDKTFDAKFTRVPERYRSVARTQLMDDILNSTPIKGKPGKIRSQIIERHLKFWDENADLFVELDDWLPEFLLKDPAFFANPQEVLESLEGMRVYKSLTPTYKKRVKRLTDKWVTLNRGTQAVRDYFERQGRVIKKRYN